METHIKPIQVAVSPKNPQDSENWQYCMSAVELKEDIEKSFLSLGERLMRIRNQQMFYPVWDSFKEFCKEMGMSDTTASRLIGIYEKYVVIGGLRPEELISPRGWDNLSKFLPYIKTKQDAKIYAEKALVLSREDAIKEAHELKTGQPMAACNHANAYLLKVCPTCGDKHKVYED